MKEQREFQEPERQLAYLVNSDELEIIPSSADLLEKLKNSYKQKRPLRVKLGIDPTTADLHLGHTVCLNSLKKFQELGHQGILIIGGFTAQLGDPTGRNEARPALSLEQVKINSQEFIKQAQKILDLERTEILDNSSWLNAINLSQLIQIASNLTVNRLLSKETFNNRLKNAHALFLHELFYPVLQGYDSSIIQADVEIGGKDQRFNVLMGREVQKHFQQDLQIAFLTDLLVGLDGEKKMSKTTGNQIALSDLPEEIYGKTMSIPDQLILDWYRLALGYEKEQLLLIKEKLAAGENPRDLKINLAKEIVEIYYSREDANLAQIDFREKFQNNSLPKEIPEYSLPDGLEELGLLEVLVFSKLSSSRGEARRAIQNQAIRVDQQKVLEERFSVKKGSIVQFGKRKFIKIV